MLLGVLPNHDKADGNNTIAIPKGMQMAQYFLHCSGKYQRTQIQVGGTSEQMIPLSCDKNTASNEWNTN